MSLTDQLITRFKAEFISQIITTVASALLIVLLARFLTAEEYGRLFLAISIIGVLQVFSTLGIAKSGARYLTEYKNQDPSQIQHILKVTFLYNLGTISIVAISLALGHQFISELIGEPDIGPLLLIGVPYIIFGTLMTYVRLTLQGFEEIQLSAILQAFNSLTRLLAAVSMVLLGLGAIGALAGYVLGFTLVALIGLVMIYIRHYHRYETADFIESGLRERVARYTIPLTITSTADVIDRQIDTILVGFFLNPVAVSFYVVGKQILLFIEVPMTALGFTLSPTFGTQKAEGDLEQSSRIYETALVHSLLLYIPAAAGIFLISEDLIKLAFGADYLGAVPVLQVFALYAIFQTITKITSNGLDYLGRARSRAIVKGITALLNFFLNLILIPLVGVVGAAIATVITYGIYTAANFYIIHTEFNLRMYYILKKMAHITSITLVMSLPILVLVDFISGWGSLLLVILTGITAWGILAIGTGILDVHRFLSMVKQ